MSRIIEDFIKSAKHGYGIGYFEGNELVVAFLRDRDIGTNQQRKFKRRKIIPTAFIAYLKLIEAIQPDACLPKHKRTVHYLLDLLSAGPNRLPGVYSEGEALRDAFLLEIFPELRNKMGSSQQLWHKIENDGTLHGLNGPGGTSRKPDYLQE